MEPSISTIAIAECLSEYTPEVLRLPDAPSDNASTTAPVKVQNSTTHNKVHSQKGPTPAPLKVLDSATPR